ncbi:MAG: LarC family nickel insertion protein [Desulfovibrio sp.]|jgi:uncharacterized protein (TIGR00299 family) protein|nr:LarC family nickel insertion protein [Desulfovibrio sp.]
MEMYLDCQGGISGDMTLAALSHLGLDLGPLAGMLEEAGVPCTVTVREECRAAGPGRRVDVDWPGDQPLRHPADMTRILDRLPLTESARGRCDRTLDALVTAEAHAHRIPPEEVHFHEVGAVDTLVDIVGACWGLETLGAERIVCSPLPWFTGTINCAHGRLPLPAPATAWLMQGKPVLPTDAREELVTPTGAALVHALADAFEGAPAGTLRRLGTGYGSRPSSMGLRAWLVDPPGAQTSGGREIVVQIETHLDHLTGEELGMALEALAEAPGALDVLWLPGTGKKNRPAGLLRVLCLPRHVEEVSGLVFRHTHTLGLRRQFLERRVLPREAAQVDCGGRIVPAKAYAVEGRRHARPEADAVQERARELGVGAPGLRISLVED